MEKIVILNNLLTIKIFNFILKTIYYKIID